MSKGSSRQLGGLSLRGHEGRIPGLSKGSSGQHGGLCWRGLQGRGLQGRILGCPRDPPDSMGACIGRDSKGGSWDVQGILWTAWRPLLERTPREHPGMSKGSSGQHGGLCLRGLQGRIPGRPRDPPDSMGGCVGRDSKGGSWDIQGILRTAWGPVLEGTLREDPGMSKGSSGQHGGLCLRGHHGMSKGSFGQHGGLCLRGLQGRIPGCPRDPPDCLDTCRQHWTSLIWIWICQLIMGHLSLMLNFSCFK